MWRHLTHRLSNPAVSCRMIALRIEHVVVKVKIAGRVCLCHRYSPIRR